MAIVSISEASKLVGKNRSTLQRHIATGKLSKAIDASGLSGIDTSELIRVYGAISDSIQHSNNDAMQHHATAENNELQQLKVHLSQQKEMYEKQLAMQQDHIETLKQAMLLLEHKQEIKKEKQGWFSRLFRK